MNQNDLKFILERKESKEQLSLLASKLDGTGEVASGLKGFTKILKEKQILEMKR